MSLEKKKIKYILILLLAIIQVHAQPVKFDVSVKPDSVTVGDPLKVIISYQAESSVQAVFQPWEQNLPEFVEFFSKDLQDTADSSEKIITYNIALFDTGMLALPPVSFKVLRQDSDTTSFTIASDSIKIHVRSIVLSTGDTTFSPPYLPVGVPFPWKKVLIPIFILCIIGLIAWWIYRKWKQKDSAVVPAEPELPQIPPFTLAKEKLQSLLRKKPRNEIERKEFFAELSFILREYLENEFDFPALESTTREIKNEIKNKIDYPELIMDGMKILEICDLVKFAKYPSSNKEFQDNVKNAISFVKKCHQYIEEKKRKLEEVAAKTGEDVP